MKIIIFTILIVVGFFVYLEWQHYKFCKELNIWLSNQVVEDGFIYNKLLLKEFEKESD